MDEKLSTSFIPKQTFASPMGSIPMKESRGLLSTLSLLVLVLSILMAGGTFVYRMYLANQINNPCPNPNQTTTSGCGLIASLKVDQESLDIQLLREMQRFDQKLSVSKVVLDNHTTLLPLYKLLSDKTLQTVRYTSFSIKDNVVEMRGLAGSYEDIAVQGNIFNADKNLKTPIFSDLDLDAKGSVLFKLNFRVSPELLSYRNYVRSSSQLNQIP